MARDLLAPDRVALLLSLVPYLQDHGPTTIDELSDAFDVDAEELRRLVRFLATSGVPGETQTYSHEDLFDIDWNALEYDDTVSLTRVVAVDDTPRFAPAETAALIAGLHSLSTMLSTADAELARALSEKLGAASANPSAASLLTVDPGPGNPTLSLLVEAIDQACSVAFDYRSVAGAESARTVDPIALTQDGTGWTLRAYCHDRCSDRSFRIEQMRNVRAGGPITRTARGSSADADEPAATAPLSELVAVIPSERLPLIMGFAPETLEILGDGGVRVRIAAWHEGTAIRLVQESLGSAVVEHPESARAAVRAWAARGLTAYRTGDAGIH